MRKIKNWVYGIVSLKCLGYEGKIIKIKRQRQIKNLKYNKGDLKIEVEEEIKKNGDSIIFLNFPLLFFLQIS